MIKEIVRNHYDKKLVRASEEIPQGASQARIKRHGKLIVHKYGERVEAEIPQVSALGVHVTSLVYNGSIGYGSLHELATGPYGTSVVQEFKGSIEEMTIPEVRRIAVGLASAARALDA